jgi:hypothetical protein
VKTGAFFFLCVLLRVLRKDWMRGALPRSTLFFQRRYFFTREYMVQREVGAYSGVLLASHARTVSSVIGLVRLKRKKELEQDSLWREQVEKSKIIGTTTCVAFLFQIEEQDSMAVPIIFGFL